MRPARVFADISGITFGVQMFKPRSRGKSISPAYSARFTMQAFATSSANPIAYTPPRRFAA